MTREFTKQAIAMIAHYVVAIWRLPSGDFDLTIIDQGRTAISNRRFMDWIGANDIPIESDKPGKGLTRYLLSPRIGKLFVAALFKTQSVQHRRHPQYHELKALIGPWPWLKLKFRHRHRWEPAPSGYYDLLLERCRCGLNREAEDNDPRRWMTDWQAARFIKKQYDQARSEQRSGPHNARSSGYDNCQG